MCCSRFLLSMINLRQSFFLSFLILTCIVILVNYVTIKQLQCEKNSAVFQTSFGDVVNDDIWDEHRFERLDLSNLSNSTAVGSSNNDSSFGNILDLVPHLRHRPFSFIEPKLLISQQNRYAKLAVGVPTVKREKEYLSRMLKSLIKSCSWNELNDIIVIVFIAEVVEF